MYRKAKNVMLLAAVFLFGLATFIFITPPNIVSAADGTSCTTQVVSGTPNTLKVFCTTTQGGGKQTGTKSCNYNADTTTADQGVKNCGGANAINGGSPTGTGNNGTGGTGAGAGTGTGAGTGATQGDVTDATQKDGDACFTGLSDGPTLSWIVCPLIDTATATISKVDQIISNQLSVNTDQIFGDGQTAKNYFTAWSSFRNLAVAVLIIGALVMIASQALGFEFLDAYTIRKVLPRLIVAIIGITLSWYIMEFVCGLFNVLGADIRSIIYAPFKTTENSAVFGGGAAAIATILSLGTLYFLGVAGALSFLATGLLAVMVAFLILVVRNIALVMIIIVAPLAIACYILPNTQKVWKLWSTNFMGLLVMYPIISAFIAAGRVFSTISQNDAGGDATGAASVGQIIGVVAYFLPYFLLPIAFRLATGTIGTIAGFVNNKNRGAFDRLSKYRGNEISRNMSDIKNGDRFAGNNIFGKKSYINEKLNKAGERAFMGRPARNRFGFGEQGRSALALQRGARNEATGKNNPTLAYLANDDDANAVLALSGGSKEGGQDAARQLFTKDGVYDEARANRAIKTANAVGFTASNTRYALTSMAQQKSRAVDAGRIDLIQDGVNRIAGNNTLEADNLIQSFAAISRGSGRFDLGGMHDLKGVQEKGESLARRMNNLSSTDTVSEQQLKEAMTHVAMMDGIGRTDAAGLMKQQGNGLKQTLRTLNVMVEKGAPEQRVAAAQTILEMQSMLPQASADNRTTFNTTLRLAKDKGGLGLTPVAADDINPTVTKIFTVKDANGRETNVSADTFGAQQSYVDGMGRRNDPTTGRRYTATSPDVVEEVKRTGRSLSEQLADRVNGATPNSQTPVVRYTSAAQLVSGARNFDREEAIRGGLNDPNNSGHP